MSKIRYIIEIIDETSDEEMLEIDRVLEEGNSLTNNFKQILEKNFKGDISVKAEVIND